MIKYKFKEDEIIREFTEYINSTYSQHYATEVDGQNVQLNDIFIADGTAEAFWKDSAIKYLHRYGKKDGKNRKDLMKVLHYTILMMYLNTKEAKVEAPTPMSLDEVLKTTKLPDRPWNPFPGINRGPTYGFTGNTEATTGFVTIQNPHEDDKISMSSISMENVRR